jgi:hypothetical protein
MLLDPASDVELLELAHLLNNIPTLYRSLSLPISLLLTHLHRLGVIWMDAAQVVVVGAILNNEANQTALSGRLQAPAAPGPGIEVPVAEHDVRGGWVGGAVVEEGPVGTQEVSCVAEVSESELWLQSEGAGLLCH